jgi:hypothetical protein
MADEYSALTDSRGTDPAHMPRAAAGTFPC